MRLKRKLPQKAVYWPPGVSDSGGQKTFSSPVEIDCRWEDRQEQRGLPGSATAWASKARVYTDHEVKSEGVLLKSRLTNALTDLTDPFANGAAAEIHEVESMPSFDNDQTLYTAYL